MKFVLVAGEASGDQLGAGLIRALKKRYPDASFAGIGGANMVGSGMTLWHSHEELAVMGLEGLSKIFHVLRLRRRLVVRLKEERPNVFIGIDTPDFNLALERKLRRLGITTVHYVSPSLWAWRGWRLPGVAKAVSRLLVLFPFEEDLYRKHHVPAICVGHPMADQIPLSFDRFSLREKLRLTHMKEVIALLPGSRMGEVKRLAPIMLDVMDKMREGRPDRAFLIPCATLDLYKYIQSLLYARESLPEEGHLHLYHGHARQALMAADVALVASGTATLEAALCKCPMVITYRLSRVGGFLAKRLVSLPWVGLPNILAKRFVVPELLLEEAQPAYLAQAMNNLLALDTPTKNKLEESFVDIHKSIQRGADELAARAVSELL